MQDVDDVRPDFGRPAPPRRRRVDLELGGVAGEQLLRPARGILVVDDDALAAARGQQVDDALHEHLVFGVRFKQLTGGQEHEEFALAPEGVAGKGGEHGHLQHRAQPPGIEQGRLLRGEKGADAGDLIFYRSGKVGALQKGVVCRAVRRVGIGGVLFAADGGLFRPQRLQDGGRRGLDGQKGAALIGVREGVARQHGGFGGFVATGNDPLARRGGHGARHGGVVVFEEREVDEVGKALCLGEGSLVEGLFFGEHEVQAAFGAGEGDV